LRIPALLAQDGEIQRHHCCQSRAYAHHGACQAGNTLCETHERRERRTLMCRDDGSCGCLRKRRHGLRGGERRRLSLRQGRVRLGLNSHEHQRLPARVGGAEVHGGSPVIMVANLGLMSCGLHRATLTVDGAIWTCGRGRYGQLGHGDAQDRLRLTRLGPEAFGGLPVVLVTCGGENTMALTGVGGCLDVRRQRQCPARPRRQDRQAPVYAGGPRALWGSQHRRGGRR
jgi:hypothetical protein